MSNDETQAEQTQEPQQDLIGTDPLAWLGNEETPGNVQDATSGALELGENLNIAYIHDLHEKLKLLMQEKQDVVFDASAVEKADAVTLQMLASFYQSAPANEVMVSWKACSDAFLDCAKLAGLSDTLGIESAS